MTQRKLFPGRLDIITLSLMMSQKDSYTIDDKDGYLTLQYKVEYNGKTYFSKKYHFSQSNPYREALENDSKEEITSYEFPVLGEAINSIVEQMEKSKSEVVEYTVTEQSDSPWPQIYYQGDDEMSAVRSYGRYLERYNKDKNNPTLRGSKPLFLIKVNGKEEIHPYSLMIDNKGKGVKKLKPNFKMWWGKGWNDFF